MKQQPIKPTVQQPVSATSSWAVGKSITTPSTNLSWHNLASWINAWYQLQGRQHSSRRYRQEDKHLQAVPLAMIANTADVAVLTHFINVLHQPNVRPPRGLRANHPTTALIVAAHNRLKQLGAESHKKQQQRAASQQIANMSRSTTEKRPSASKNTSHLSLF